MNENAEVHGKNQSDKQEERISRRNALKRIAAASLGAAVGLNVFSSGPAGAYEDQYFFVFTWGNKKLGYGSAAESENGADGVAYFSDVLYCGDYFNKSGVALQFTEAFYAEYGKKYGHAYCNDGNLKHRIRVYDTRSAAENARRREISRFKSDDAIVRYFYDFEYYADEDSGYSGYSSYSSYSSYRYSSYSSYSSYRYSSYRYSSYTRLPSRQGPYIQRGVQ